jgi:hypothetical protein
MDALASRIRNISGNSEKNAMYGIYRLMERRGPERSLRSLCDLDRKSCDAGLIVNHVV